MAARGIEVLYASHSLEVIHESEGQLKFFGAKQLSEQSIVSSVKAVLEERCSYLVALPHYLGPNNILDIGWTGDLVEDYKIIAYLCNSGGLLIKRVGEFDDVEKGIIAIGQPALVNALHSVQSE